MPALVQADDDGYYVVKLRGAGQGPKALVMRTCAREYGPTFTGARSRPRRLAGDRIRTG